MGPADDDARAELGVSVVAEGDVIDAPVAWDGATAAAFDGSPIRYPVGDGSGAIVLEPDTPLSAIEDELAQDDAVVVLRPGVYPGDLTIRGRGVPSSNATLLDNYGLAPLEDVPAERCEPASGGADSTTGG